MKIRIPLLCAAMASGLLASAQSLPVKEILGQEYYVYEIKKGDSLYGLAHRYGWDQTELLRLNPSLADGMKKGLTVYYPTGRTVEVAVEDTTPRAALDPSELPPLEHVVRRGETVYGIARRYGIPVSAIYDSAPSTKSGIRAGEKIVIDPQLAGFGTSLPYFFVTVQPGDTLYSLARKYSTTVSDLLSQNPGTMENNIRAGEPLKIPLESSMPKVERKMVEQTQVASITPYKVEKDDTWTDIARKTGTDEQELRQANAGVDKLKKNEVVAVPEVQTVEVEREIPFTDPREQDAAGRREIYDSIHHLDAGEENRSVRIAILMDDLGARRDAEFSRGFLLALKEMGNPGYKVDVRFLPPGDRAETMAGLEDFKPQAVVELSDKGPKEWMVVNGDITGTETISVFDSKSDMYLSEPSLIQLMTPSADFYRKVADAMANDFSGCNLLVVSSGDSSDPLSEEIASAFPGGKVSYCTVESLTPSRFSPAVRTLVFADINDKEQVEELLRELSAIRKENPFLEFSVAGRPSWVMFAESMKEAFQENAVTIPSRFFFNSDSDGGKAFIESYTAEFGRGPLKSYPNYAATGWDVANTFVPMLAANAGDFNASAVTDAKWLQTPYAISRPSSWGGLANEAVLMVGFTPYRTVEVRQLP